MCVATVLWPTQYWTLPVFGDTFDKHSGGPTPQAVSLKWPSSMYPLWCPHNWNKTVKQNHVLADEIAFFRRLAHEIKRLNITVSRQSRVCPTTASLSAPAPRSRRQLWSSSVQILCVLQRTVPLHVWEIALLLLQDSDCGTVSQQNYDNLSFLSDNSVAC